VEYFLPVMLRALAEHGAERPLSGGLAGCCRSARKDLGFPASEPDALGTPRPFLPADLVRIIDSFTRSLERAERLREMNGGRLAMTLRCAAEAGGCQDVCFLLAAGVDAGAEDGRALTCACNHGHVRVAEALLEARGLLTARHLNLALRFAAYFGRTACCALLLERGADVHHREEAALKKALQLAKDNRHDAVFALLLARRRGGGA